MPTWKAKMSLTMLSNFGSHLWQNVNDAMLQETARIFAATFRTFLTSTATTFLVSTEFWGLKATVTRNSCTVHWTCLRPTTEQPEKQTSFREANTGCYQVFCVKPLAQTAAESKFQINKSSARDFRCYASNMSFFCGPGRAQTEHLFGIRKNPDASACKHPWIPRAWLTAQACTWSLDGQITWRKCVKTMAKTFHWTSEIQWADLHNPRKSTEQT